MLHQKTVRTSKQISKVAAYKINIQKSVAFQYKNNEFFKKKLKIIPISIASKTIKYLGIYLTKEVKGLYTEN